MEMKYTLRPNTWLINGDRYIYISSSTSWMWRFPLLFMGCYYQKYFIQNITEWHSKMGFLLLLIIQKYCDYSVFNLNHYLLLSYSRMIKVIKRNIIWDISSIFKSFLQSFKCLKEYSLKSSSHKRPRFFNLIKGNVCYLLGTK